MPRAAPSASEPKKEAGPRRAWQKKKTAIPSKLLKKDQVLLS